MTESQHYVGKVAEYAVLINDKEQILLLYVGNKPKFVEYGINGLAHLPGGRFDFGDIPQQSLRREIEEETGLTDFKIICAFTTKFWQHGDERSPAKIKSSPRYSVGYIAFTKGTPDIHLPEGEDHDHAEWMSFEKALAQRFSHPAIKEIVAEAQKWLKNFGKTLTEVE